MRFTSWFCLLVSALVLGGLWTFFHVYDPCVATAASVSTDGDFESSASLGTNGPWKPRGACVERTVGGGMDASAGVRIDVEGPRKGVIEFSTTTPLSTGTHLRFTGWMRTERLVQGAANWDCASFFVIGRNAAGRLLWEYPHEVCRVTGTQGWTRFEKTFFVPPQANGVSIIAINGGETGTMWVDNIQVMPVRYRPMFVWWRILAATLWCLTAVTCVGISHLWQRSWGPAILVIAAVITAGCVLPQNILLGISSLPELVNRPSKTQSDTGVLSPSGKDSSFGVTPDWATSFPMSPVSRRTGRIKMVAHIGLFACLGFTAWDAWYRRRREPSFEGSVSHVRRVGGHIAVVFSLALFAAGTEILQFVTLTRTAAFANWVLDVASMGGAIVLSGALHALTESAQYDSRPTARRRPGPAHGPGLQARRSL